MSTRKELINGGLYMQEAVATGGAVDLGVTVNKSVMVSQATAYKITASNTGVTTSDATPASGQNALVLPATDQGDWMQVSNFSANAIYIWPAVGWGIHGTGQNVTYLPAAGKTATFTTVTDANKPLPQGAGAVFTFHQVMAMQG